MRMQAYADGWRAGRADKRTGIRNDYSWFVENSEGYPRDYSLGYRAGWRETEV